MKPQALTYHYNTLHSSIWLPFGPQSVFKLIPNMLDGVDVRTLCRLVKFFTSSGGKPLVCGPGFELWGALSGRKRRRPSPKPADNASFEKIKAV